MSKSAGRLSLGPLPRADVVKLTIALPADLKEQLDQYAEAHGKMHGPVDVLALIPHMLATFMARDRGFKALRRSANWS